MPTIQSTLAASMPRGAALTPSDLSVDRTFETDRYVVEAIHRAESGRRAWLIVALLLLTTVAAFALAGA